MAKAELLQELYQTTLEALAEARNDRLWFKTNLKLCKMFFSLKEFPRVSKILRERTRFCRNEDGSANQARGTQLLEVYAIEIQMFTEQKNNKKLKELQRALAADERDPAPVHPGDHPRVRRQDAHGGALTRARRPRTFSSRSSSTKAAGNRGACVV